MQQAPEDEPTLFCVCRTRYDPNRFYIWCDRCEEWFHGECIVPPIAEHRSRSIPTFYCNACRAPLLRRWAAVLGTACAADAGPSACSRVLELRAYTRELRSLLSDSSLAQRACQIATADLQLKHGVSEAQHAELRILLDALGSTLVGPAQTSSARPAVPATGAKAEEDPESAAERTPPRRAARTRKRLRYGEDDEGEDDGVARPAWQRTQSLWAEAETAPELEGAPLAALFGRLLGAEPVPEACEAGLARDAGCELPAGEEGGVGEEASAVPLDWLRTGGFDRPTVWRAGPTPHDGAAAPAPATAAGAKQRSGGSTDAVCWTCPRLGLRVPVRVGQRPLGVEHVGRLLGGEEHTLDVLDVATQETRKLSFAAWAAHMRTRPVSKRTRLLNLISLEISQTALGALVEPPAAVRAADWALTAWPSAPAHAAAAAPRVAKYCLLGTQGSFTDFHVDMGGTSVWYHVVRGAKTFFVAPPSAANLRAFEEWSRSDEQAATFFGRRADACARLELRAGDTLLIPSLWIHAVHTPVDSVVFGGNFLHTAHARAQLRALAIERRAGIDAESRYPRSPDVHWFAALRHARELGVEWAREEPRAVQRAGGGPKARAGGGSSARGSRQEAGGRGSALSHAERDGVLALCAHLAQLCRQSDASTPRPAPEKSSAAEAPPAWDWDDPCYDPAECGSFALPEFIGSWARAARLVRGLCTAVGGLPQVDALCEAG